MVQPLSFEQWRKMKNLHENIGGAIPLGVSQPQSFSTFESQVQVEDLRVDELSLEALEQLEAIIQEAKKAKKKKMDVELDKAPERDIEIKKKVDIDDEEIDDDEIDDEIDDDEVVDDEVDDDKIDDKEIMLSKKKAKKKAKKKMTKEESEWLASVRGQMLGDNSVHWDGTGDEPAPGEPGFAPQQRVGWFA